jgi:hypothetical protein
VQYRYTLFACVKCFVVSISCRETLQRLVPFDDFGMRTDLNRGERQPNHTMVDKAPHLLRIEPEDLQTLHSRSARQSDVALALLKHPAEIDLDAL